MIILKYQINLRKIYIFQNIKIPYVLIGESGRGKSWCAKNLMKRLQDESKVKTILFLLVSFPGEWNKGQKNTD